MPRSEAMSVRCTDKQRCKQRPGGEDRACTLGSGVQLQQGYAKHAARSGRDS